MGQHTGDRLVILIVAATGFAVLVGGWAGGLVHAELSGWSQLVVRLLLGAIFIAIVVGFWLEFKRID